jgi:hypothetical protein
MAGGRDEPRTGPCQAATPAALRHVQRFGSEEPVSASGDKMTRNGEDVVGGRVQGQEPLG